MLLIKLLAPKHHWPSWKSKQSSFLKGILLFKNKIHPGLLPHLPGRFLDPQWNWPQVFNIEPDHILLINHKYMSSQISHDGLNLETKSWFLSISLTKPKQASKNRNIWWRRGFPDHWQVCHLKNSNTMPYHTILLQAVWFALFVVVTDRHIDHGLTTNSTNLWQITINCIWYWLPQYTTLLTFQIKKKIL